VHYLVDEQFQATRASILKVLEEPRYGGVRAAFEDAYKHFDRDDTKAAVRSMYEALEILAKLLKPGSPRLTKELVNDLRKQYSNRYDPKDEAARTAYNALFDAMVPFAVGLHVYRHGQAAQTAIAPDEITSVNVLNTGAAHIRWLIDLDIKAPLTST
jgi:leucyl-tRNA synthetase